MHSHPIASIIDDDESVRIATSSLVRSLGWDVRLYASAEDFLASGQIADVACVISDVQMPGMSGLDLQRHLAGSGNRVPVILITAFPLDHVRRQAEADGAVGFFAKPFDARLMIDCIERALVRKGDP